MELTPERLTDQLPREPLRPVYLVAGQEPLRVLEAADAVRAQARANGCDEREVFDADGRDFDWGEVAAAFGSFGLFSSQRLVEVRLPSGKPGKDGATVITEFCADPPAGVTLLIVAGDWSKAHAGKWSEAVARAGHVAVAWSVKPHELVDWMERRLRAEGEVVVALLGMVVRELQIAEKLAQVQAGGGNLNAEFKAQRIWDSKQALYLRALKRHGAPRWQRFLAMAGQVDRIAKGRASGDAWLALERLLVAVAEPRALALIAS